MFLLWTGLKKKSNFHVTISLQIKLKTEELHLFMETGCNNIECEIPHSGLNCRSM